MLLLAARLKVKYVASVAMVSVSLAKFLFESQVGRARAAEFSLVVKFTGKKLSIDTL